jgi:hypothetical protein
MNVQISKLPFNDRKHSPSRPEIDLLVGIVPSSELKRLERQIEWMDNKISWSMEWYENAEGWGYRASYMNKVLVILHFYKGFFSASMSIPLKKEAGFIALKEVTAAHLRQFENCVLSPQAKWVTLRIQKREDMNSLLALLQHKLEDIKLKSEKKRKREE